PSSYEEDLYSAAEQGVLRVGDLFDLPSFDFLLGHTFRYTTHYAALWILWVLTLVMIARRREWPLFLLVAIAVPAYILLNVFTYHAGETAIFMEKNYLPLAALVSIPLMYEVVFLPLRWMRYALLPFVLVLFLQFRGIT